MPRHRKFHPQREEGGKLTNKQVLQRARDMFPGRKPRKTGAGNYTAGELLTVCKSLEKDPPEDSR